MSTGTHKISVVILALFLVTGCKTYEYFNIEVLEPADLFLSPNIQSLAVAHNISLADADSTGMPFRIYDRMFYDTAFIDTSLARISTAGLADGLHTAGRFITALIDSLPETLPKNTTDFTIDDVNYIRRICDDNNANAFLVLNRMEHENGYDTYLDKSGGFYGVFDVVMKTEWLLINPYTSKLLDKKLFSDTLYYEVESMEIDKNDDGFKARKEVLEKAALVSGYTYASWISPHYVQSSRLIFTKGDHSINMGYEQAQAGNWKNAAHFWRQALASDDKKIVAKAYFNLALASEMEGLLEPALEWAQESYSIFPDDLNITYISILEKRIRQQEEIIKQMRFETVGE